MKNYFNIRHLLVGLSIIMSISPLQASEVEPEKREAEWFYSHWYGGVVISSGISYETKDRWDYSVSIESSKDNSTLLYISVDERNTNICETNDDLPTVIIVEDQAIGVFSWCKTYLDSEKKYALLTPKNDKGHNFMVNKFKTLNTVTIDLKRLGMPSFSAAGFTKEWNTIANIL